MKRDIIRVNDTVRIINPRSVVRVGYPKILNDYLPEVEKEYKAVLYTIPTEAVNKVRMALAYAMAVKDKFGGNERSIHFEDIPGLINEEYKVMNIRYARTGKYCAGGGSTSWDGESDYEPPYLYDIKCHKILHIGYCGRAPYILEVLATDVEKVKCEVKQLCHQS